MLNHFILNDARATAGLIRRLNLSRLITLHLTYKISFTISLKTVTSDRRRIAICMQEIISV